MIRSTGGSGGSENNRFGWEKLDLTNLPTDFKEGDVLKIFSKTKDDPGTQPYGGVDVVIGTSPHIPFYVEYNILYYIDYISSVTSWNDPSDIYTGLINIDSVSSSGAVTHRGSFSRDELPKYIHSIYRFVTPADSSGGSGGSEGGGDSDA